MRVGTGVRISYAVSGADDGVPLLLLPGAIDSWRSYAPVLPHLPTSIRAIAMSHRGHGDSDKPDDGYAVDQLGRDAAALLDALAIDRPVVVAAHSGSCLVARWLAIHEPARVAGLVLEASPLVLGGLPAFDEFVAGFVADLKDPIDPAVLASFVTDTSAPDLDPAILRTAIEDAAKVPAHVWHQVFAGLGAYDDSAGLAALDVPVLLVWGDRDGLIGRATQDELVASLPSAELVVYEGCGHTPRWEQPARFAADLTRMCRPSNL